MPLKQGIKTRHCKARVKGISHSLHSKYKRKSKLILISLYANDLEEGLPPSLPRMKMQIMAPLSERTLLTTAADYATRPLHQPSSHLASANTPTPPPRILQ